MSVSESVERRYLGGVRFVDVSNGAPVTAPLSVSSAQADFFANRRGIHVIHSVPGLAAHQDSFAAPPAQPALGSVPVSGVVLDRHGTYLPRRFSLELPRAAERDAQASLFEPIDFALYPAGCAVGERNWAIVRAALRAANDASVAVSGALARVLRESDGQLLGQGMSELRFDARRPERVRPTAGELVIFVPGIPVTTWGDADEPAVVQEVAVRLEIVFDPNAGDIPDPDALSALPAPAQNRWTFKLATGRTHHAGQLAVVPS
jgi:hypothetical protein